MASSPSRTTLSGMSNPALLNALWTRITSSSRSSSNRMIGSLFMRCRQLEQVYQGPGSFFHGVDTYRHAKAESNRGVIHPSLNQTCRRPAAAQAARDIQLQRKGEGGFL